MSLEPVAAPTDVGARPGWDAGDARALLLIVLAWLAGMVCAMPWGNFPINDDWVYGLAVQSVLEQGRYQFMSQPSSANVGPMVWWGALFCLPFGFSYDALRVSTIVLGLIALGAMYVLVRQCGGSRAGAALAASTLGFHPLFFGLSASFMTDVPFVALTLVACCLLVRSLRGEDPRALVAGFAVALAAVLTRQLGVALLVGWAAAWIHRRGLGWRSAAAAALALAAGLGAHLGYQYWLVHTGRTLAIGHHSDPVNLLRQADTVLWTVRYSGGLMIAYLGFLVFPVVLWFTWPSRAEPSGGVWRHRRVPFVALALAAVVVALAMTPFGRLPLPAHNVLSSWSLGPLLLRDVEILKLNHPLLPPPIVVLWGFVNLAALAAAVLLLTWLVPVIVRLAVRWRREAARPGHERTSVIVLLLATAITYSAVMLFASVRFTVFDRYWLYVAPLLMAAVFAIAAPGAALPPDRIARRLRGTAWTAVAVLGTMSVTMTHDFMAASRARWRLLDQATQRDGIDPRRIDGGYEFNGPRLFTVDYVRKPNRSWWWVDGNEYVVAAGPMPGYTEVDRREFGRWFLGGSGQIVLLRRTPP